MNIGWRLVVENGLLFAISTGFLAITARSWQKVQTFQLPKPLPGWFKVWFGSVQFLGIVPPAIALGWSVWQGIPNVWQVLTAYFVMLVVQVISEYLTLRQLQSVIWVMVPYLYVPYRLWQLWEGVLLTASQQDLSWLQLLLIGEIVVWGINYLLDLAQLPRLLRWPGAATESAQ